MKIFFVLCLLLITSNILKASDSSEKIALRFLELINNEEYLKASEMSSEEMLSFLSDSKIKEFWTSLKSRYGKLQGFGEPIPQKSNENSIYLIKLYYSNDSLNARVVVDSSEKIAGLLFVPFPRTYDFTSPNYVDSTKFSERQVRFGIESWELPAILSVPNGSGKFPAVVLVHGSGPHDKDATIGGHKVFRDIALGLASRGIAVLRYEKRTKWHANKIMRNYKNLTVYEETIQDAVAAAEFLKTQDNIDPDKIFVLGHSMGGYLMPRIAEKADWLAGVIIANSNARKLYELVPDQVEYIFKLDGELSSNQLEEIAKIREQIRLIEEGKIGDSTPRDSLVLGLPAKYLLDLRDYKPLDIIQQFDNLVLVLQCEKDYQVTNLEFDLWKEALSQNPKATFHNFSNLNHLFVFTEGISKPIDYEGQGFVDEKVINFIVDWLKEQ